MNIIKIEPYESGGHDNQFGAYRVPEGWAVIPGGMDIPDTFPFVDIIVSNRVVTEMTKGEVPDLSQSDLAEAKSTKEFELSAACNAAIVSGVDVETTQGMEHFSLEETDQINLTTAYNAVMSSAESYPYHADGTLCRMFTADEIKAISNASIAHKLYHTTLCNHLLTWVRRAETELEVESITYTAEGLPEDLAANMAQVLAAATSVSEEVSA